MRLLIVEDNSHKLQQVTAFVRAHWPQCELLAAESVQSAMRKLTSMRPSAVLLDMSLPILDYSSTEDGFTHLSYGGRDILDFLSQADMRIPVIVVTAFDRFGEGPDAVTLIELDSALKEEFPDNYLGSVHYSAVSDAWQSRLKTLLVTALDINAGGW